VENRGNVGSNSLLPTFSIEGPLLDEVLEEVPDPFIHPLIQYYSEVKVFIFIQACARIVIQLISNSSKIYVDIIYCDNQKSNHSTIPFKLCSLTYPTNKLVCVLHDEMDIS
jgi:hypothetical protein